MHFLIIDKNMDTADRIQLGISYLLQAILFIASIVSFIRGNWLNAFLTIGILFLTFLPKIIRQSYQVFLPVEFDVLAIIFIFAALYLGEIHSYYTLFWWWDIVLHTSSGFLLGITGFLLMYILTEEKRIPLKMNPGFVSLFAFTFALAVGVLWELFEFFMDSNFSFNMQRLESGVVDTMRDLIVDALGALVIAVVGYFYMRKGQFLLFDRMIHRFVERNPKLFRKKKIGGIKRNSPAN